MPTPEPGPGQVLIRPRAAGVNPMDRALASGAWKPMPATFPMVLGADGAGVVEQLGPGASSRVSVGDDLFGRLLIAPLGSAGTYAEYVAVTEDALLARVPGGLDDVVAAALPTAGGAGLALVDLLEPLADKTVLIVGAGGGVGSFATQFAANAGASVIANVRVRMRSACARTALLRRSITQRSTYPTRSDRPTRTASMSSSKP
jgi:NADPH:quinone reductase